MQFSKTEYKIAVNFLIIQLIRGEIHEFMKHFRNFEIGTVHVPNLSRNLENQKLPSLTSNCLEYLKLS